MTDDDRAAEIRAWEEEVKPYHSDADMTALTYEEFVSHKVAFDSAHGFDIADADIYPPEPGKPAAMWLTIEGVGQ